MKPPKNEREKDIYHQAFSASKSKSAKGRMTEAMTALTAYRKKRKGMESAAKAALSEGSISEGVAKRNKVLNDPGK